MSETSQAPAKPTPERTPSGKLAAFRGSPMFLMKSKPLFNWVPPPDGRQRPARELMDYCIGIQKFFFKVKEMDAEQVRKTYTEEVVALGELAAENGIKVLEPQWFARLFR